MLKDVMKKFGVLLVLSMLVMICVGAVSADGPTSNNVQLHISFSGSVETPCAVSGDYLIYGIGYGNPGDPVGLACYNYKTGDNIWFREIGAVNAEPAISEGKVFVPAASGKLYCLDLDTGATEWNISGLTAAGYPYYSYGPVVSDGVVYLFTENSVVGYNIETQKKVFEKSVSVSPKPYTKPLIDDKGNIIFPTGTSVVSYTPEETEVGSVPVTGAASTVVQKGDNIYFTNGSKIFSVDTTSDWKILWCEDANVYASTLNKLAVGEKAVYAYNTNSNLSAYNISNGKPLEGFTTHVSGVSARPHYLSPVLSGDGETVYYATNSGPAYLFAVDAETGTEKWNVMVPKLESSTNWATPFGSSPILANDRIFFGTEYGGIFVIGDGEKKEADGTKLEETWLFDDSVTLTREDVGILLKDGETEVETPGTSGMAAVAAAAESGDFTYKVSYSEYGFYLEELAGIAGDDTASTYWIVQVNDVSASVGLGELTLNDRDVLTLYYCLCEYDPETGVSTYHTDNPIHVVNIIARINPDFTLTLNQGWNFLSIPQTLANGADTAGVVFAGIDTANNAVLGYNAETQKWENLGSSSELKPLAAYWIYSNADTAEMRLFYKAAEATDLPTSLKVYEGWNAVGVDEEVTASVFLDTLREKWAVLFPWDADAGELGDRITANQGTNTVLSVGCGNWLYADENGVLTEQ